jgi:hypothetical protein
MLRWPNEESWDGWDMEHAWVKWDVRTKFQLEALKGRDCLRRLIVDGKIILKLTLQKSDVKAWTVFNWFTFGSNGCLLWTRKLTFGFHKTSECLTSRLTIDFARKTQHHASRPRKDFTPPFRAARSQQYSFANFATVRVLSCFHSPGLRCSCCKGGRFCCDLETCNLVTATINWLTISCQAIPSPGVKQAVELWGERALVSKLQYWVQSVF